MHCTILSIICMETEVDELNYLPKFVIISDCECVASALLCCVVVQCVQDRDCQHSPQFPQFHEATHH